MRVSALSVAVQAGALLPLAGLAAAGWTGHLGANPVREATLRTGEAHFHSRSRGRLWRKGEESGNVLAVEAIAFARAGGVLKRG